MMATRELFEDIDAIISARRRAKVAGAETTAPDFTPLDFLDTRERGLSRIIAWLLDPRGSHAQGSAFLLSFLEWLGLDAGWREQAGAAKVILEAPTAAFGHRGYIDVLVRLPGRLLAIENKPKAIDQPGQVRRYLADLASRRLTSYCLVYLSGSGAGPTQESVGADELNAAKAAGTLKIRSYASMPEWLKLCTDCCRAPAVGHMLQGIATFVRREYAGVSDVVEAEQIAKSVRSSPDKLEAALATIEAEAAIKGAIISDLVAEVRRVATARRGWNLVRDDLGPVRWSALAIGLAPQATVGFGVCFDMTYHRWLFYGVTSFDGRPLPRNVRPVLQGLIGSTTGTGTWPVWRQVGINDRFFPLPKQVGRDFWHGAQDGTLARMIVEFADEVQSALRDAKLLTAVRERTTREQ